jgi:hypothetical protein
MTDKEIISIMYDHATGFSSCIQFSDDAAVIAFARDLLGQAIVDPEPEPEPEPGSAYKEKLDECIQLIDQFIKQNQK